MSKETGGPAFPYEHKFGDGTANRDEGMTLRDYFAAKAPLPPAWWMKYWASKVNDLDAYADCITQWNYIYADSMLRARGSKQ